MTPKIALKEMGLSDQEADVYVSLLRSGGAIASAVAKDVGLKRTTVYPILKSMKKKGFVKMYYRKSKQLFYPEKPQRVATFFEKKITGFVDAIPALESLEKKNLTLFGLRFIETLDELKLFYEEILDEYKGGAYSVIGSTSDWQTFDPDFFIDFRKRRADQKTRTRLLLTQASKEDSPGDSSLLRDVRWIPGKYTFKSTIDIYEDKVLVVSPELSSLAVVIAIPAMVDVFQAIFDMMWDVVEKK